MPERETMKTTEVLVEHFVGGILVTAILLFFFWSVFPDQVQISIKSFSQQLNNFTALTGAVLSATAYSLGILAESACRFVFDRYTMAVIKEERLKRYLDINRDQLSRSPVLAQFSDRIVSAKGIRAVQIDRREAGDAIGLMRFVVMKSSPGGLYREVESSLGRLRLVRILFFVEAGVVLGFIPWLWRYPSNVLLWACLLLFAFFLFVNWWAIYYRCSMYCRAIERSYKLLVLEPQGESKASEATAGT